MANLICQVCNEACSKKVAYAHKASGKWPEIYFPGVRLESGKLGHVECLIAAGEMPPPPIHKEAWDKWEEAGRPTVEVVDRRLGDVIYLPGDKTT